ncbi:HTH domain-containing protein [Aureliella helgolandensis]|uniref:HTH HARE-type domain-containing protein n=1 Tax=Aureliella helgolandensis TaxID=2527968 RepID=A0A518G7S8_9BACT|nr:HTH domain-containing protein [Aureliella helgolandensis]QDV24622.1 hypothetical protein Q31a_29420 [Aureliella helgolandensis]
MKKAIHEIAADILSEHKKPMTADEIYGVIVAGGLYEFKAQNPKNVLRNQLRRHSTNVSGAHQASKAIFMMASNGQFTLA